VCGDLAQLGRLAASAGLRLSGTRTHLGTVKCPPIEAFVTTEVEASPLRERISDVIYERIRRDAREALRPFTTAEGAAAIPLRGHLLTATKDAG
jgi:hypothetical protein